MAREKIDVKNIDKRIVDLKIELLKDPTKRGRIKKEIARMLTMRNEKLLAVSREPLGKDSGNIRTKLEEKAK